MIKTTTGSGPRAGYYFSAAFVLAGTALLSLIDVHKNNLRRRRRRRQSSCRREEEVAIYIDQNSEGGGGRGV